MFKVLSPTAKNSPGPTTLEMDVALYNRLSNGSARLKVYDYGSSVDDNFYTNPWVYPEFQDHVLQMLDSTLTQLGQAQAAIKAREDAETTPLADATNTAWLTGYSTALELVAETLRKIPPPSFTTRPVAIAHILASLDTVANNFEAEAKSIRAVL